MFHKGSRYARVETREWTDANGRAIPYKAIRFVPRTPPERGHVVRQGERLDGIAHEYFRDPERYWRICDANGTVFPERLTDEPGATIAIPSAED